MPRHTDEERQRTGLQETLAHLPRVIELERFGLDEDRIRKGLEVQGFNSAQIRTLLIARKREQAGLPAEKPPPAGADPLGAALRASAVPSEVAAALAFSAIPGTETSQRAREFRQQGVGTFEAARRGFREADLPPGVKLGARVALDPLNLLPVVGFPGTAARLATAPVRAGVGAAGRAGTAGIREAVQETAEQTVRRAAPSAEQAAQASARPSVGERVAALQPAQPPGPPPGPPPIGQTAPQLPGGPVTHFPPTNTMLWDNLLYAHLDAPNAQTLLRGAAEAAQDLPGAGHLIRSTNPSALARQNPVLREGVGYRLVEQVQDATMSNRLARFSQAVPFDVDDAGRIATSRGRVAFGDVAENPGRYNLTPEQSQWIESAHNQIDLLAANYEDVTGKILRRDLEREHYWPRFVRQEGRVGVRSRVGARQSPIQERLIPTMEEGLERGVPYETDPILQLQAYMQAVQKMTRDELLIQRLVDKGLARTKGATRITRNEVAPEEFARFDLIMDREAAEILRGPLGPSAGAVVRTAEAASGLSRQLVTGLMDAGQFFIQMLPLLATSPARWGRSVGISLRTLVQPKFYQRWVAQSAEAKRVAPFGVDPGLSSEFFQATPLLSRIPLLGRVLGPLSRGAQRTFESALGAGRILYADGLMDAATATGAGRDELFRIARQADTLLGTPSTKALGISATQRQVENAFLFFSSRYTRSVFGTFAYLFGKGFGPQQVRKTMAKLALGGAATYYGLGQASGMSNRDILEGLNPASGKRFMSINIGGANFGLGGAYRSLVAAIGGLTNKRSWDFDNWDDALLDNPLIRYMRSRSSPLTGTLVDFLDGQDFIGRPFSIEAFADNPQLLLDQIIQRGAPFPIQGLLEVQGGVETRAAALGGEAVGLRVSPTTFSDAADQVTREIGLGRSYRGLEPYQKDLVEQDPRVKRVQERQPRFGTFKELTQVDEEYEGQISALVRFAQGPAPAAIAPKGSFKYRNAIVGTFYDLEAERANQKEGIRRDAGITFSEGGSQSEQDLSRWYQLVDEAKQESGGGVVLPGALEGKRLAFQQQIGSVRFSYVLRNIFLRPVPEEILQYLSPTAQAWRRRADAERSAHSSGRTPSVGFGGTGTTSEQISDAVRRGFQ